MSGDEDARARAWRARIEPREANGLRQTAEPQNGEIVRIVERDDTAIGCGSLERRREPRKNAALAGYSAASAKRSDDVRVGQEIARAIHDKTCGRADAARARRPNADGEKLDHRLLFARERSLRRVSAERPARLRTRRNRDDEKERNCAPRTAQ